MTVVHIPTTMRRFTDGEKKIEIEGATVGDLLDQLTTRFPKLQNEIRNQDGGIKQFIAIFVNDTDLRSLDHLQTTLSARDEVHIIPAMAGG